jgi:hypothetical protein
MSTRVSMKQDGQTSEERISLRDSAATRGSVEAALRSRVGVPWIERHPVSFGRIWHRDLAVLLAGAVLLLRGGNLHHGLAIVVGFPASRESALRLRLRCWRVCARLSAREMRSFKSPVPPASLVAMASKTVSERPAPLVDFQQARLPKDGAEDHFRQLWSKPSPPRPRVPLAAAPAPSRSTSRSTLCWVRRELFELKHISRADCFPVVNFERIHQTPKLFSFSREHWGGGG